MPRTRDQAQVAEAKRLASLGLPTRAIAAQLGRDHGTIAAWLRDAGAAARRGPRGRTDVRDAQILRLRDRDGLSYAEIARTVHMSTTGVRMRYYQLTGRGRPRRP